MDSTVYHDRYAHAQYNEADNQGPVVVVITRHSARTVFDGRRQDSCSRADMAKVWREWLRLNSSNPKVKGVAKFIGMIRFPSSSIPHPSRPPRLNKSMGPFMHIHT